MRNPVKKSLLTALGAVFVSTAAIASVTEPSDAVFKASELKTGYMVTAEGKCGEGKCGGSMDKAKEAAEAKCGEGKCGGST